MAKHEVTVCCWSYGHETTLAMTKRQEERLATQLKSKKAVCPTCRNNGTGNEAVFIKSGETLFSLPKVYLCRHGHATTVSLMGKMLHVRYGPGSEDFVNVEGSAEELPEFIDSKDISCHHVRDSGKPCGCKLKPVDDVILSQPEAAGIKTKTRIGDLWDKAGVEPVRNGSYDANGNYQATHTEAANLARLQRMRERNIPADKHPGKRITKPTTKQYHRRSKGDVDMNK